MHSSLCSTAHHQICTYFAYSAVKFHHFDCDWCVDGLSDWTVSHVLCHVVSDFSLWLSELKTEKIVDGMGMIFCGLLNFTVLPQNLAELASDLMCLESDLWNVHVVHIPQGKCHSTDDMMMINFAVNL